MSKDITTDRAALQKAASLVRPALADKAYIPALTHIAFTPGWALAFDDKLALAVRCNAELQCLVPGVLLVQGLSSFGGKDILFQRDSDGALIMKSGRSKVKLPTLPSEAHPFKWPKDETASMDLEPDMVKAIERCLISVDSSSSRPAAMGVTLDADFQDHAVFFSTDDNTISRAQCKTKVALPGGAPVILPKAFCEQVVVMGRAFPDALGVLILGPGWLEASFEERGEIVARVFARVPVDLEPMDFPRVVQKHCGDVANIKKKLCVVPDEFDSALGRALLVLAGEVKKKTTITIQDSNLKMKASSDMGDSDDAMKIDADDVGPVVVEAGLVSRGLKGASRIGITDVVTILAGGEDCEFIHLVAHIREK